MNARICGVDECERHVTARGLCRMHYLREYRAGTHTAKPKRQREQCPPDHAHDLETCWTEHGCRCDRCVHLRAMDRQRRRNRLRAYGRGDQVTVPRVLAAPVREHVARLHAAGFGIERIGVAASVGHGAMMDLWYGPRGYPPRHRKRVRRDRQAGGGMTDNDRGPEFDRLYKAMFAATKSPTNITLTAMVRHLFDEGVRVTPPLPETVKPRRVQQSRAKGWRKPDNTVSVARPGKFGNPFAAKIPRGEEGQATMTREYLVEDFREWLTTPLFAGKSPKGYDSMLGVPYADRARILDNLHELRGKNLMCFCPLSQPCHADVLLELANGDPA